MRRSPSSGYPGLKLEWLYQCFFYAGFPSWWRLHSTPRFIGAKVLIWSKLFTNRCSWIQVNLLVALRTQPITIEHGVSSVWITLNLFVHWSDGCMQLSRDTQNGWRWRWFHYLLPAFYQVCICKEPRSRHLGLQNVETLPRWGLPPS